jgi:hypothetical protein
MVPPSVGVVPAAKNGSAKSGYQRLKSRAQERIQALVTKVREAERQRDEAVRQRNDAMELNGRLIQRVYQLTGGIE